jgi:hypothetical protein
MSKISPQNSLVIQLARECLELSGFNNVKANQGQGTFPRVYVTAERAGVKYLIGITGREEIQPDGKPREDYTLLRTAEDRKNAQELVQKMGRVPGFVAVALRIKDGTYLPYFRDLGSMGFPRFVPMKPADRSRYQLLTAPTNPDPRIRRLSLL